MIRRPTPSNPLHTLAEWAYTLAQHQPHWNKQPLEPDVRKSIYHNPHNRSAVHAYERPAGEGVVDPEDFVWCASLQVRNAWVLRCAAEWPGVLSALSGGKPHCNEGPLIDAVDRIRDKSARHSHSRTCDRYCSGTSTSLKTSSCTTTSCSWSWTSTAGRITHVFAMHDGQPVPVSGNLKAYQFLGDERIYRGQLPCDGAVLQNTVFVPNHRYIASDIEQSLHARREVQPQAAHHTGPRGGQAVRR